MKHSSIISNGLYYLTKISDIDKSDILLFKCRKESGFLEGYLKECALNDEKTKLMCTYLVRDILTNELVAYFSLKAGFVATNEERKLFYNSFDSTPAVELANFAIIYEYIKAHPVAKGVGKIVFNDFVKYVVKNASNWIGINIYLYFRLAK